MQRRITYRNVIFSVVVVLCLVAAVIVESLAHADDNRRYASIHDGCLPGKTIHTFTIRGDAVSPAHITAPRCDMLVIVNQDNVEREIAFGPHEDHVAYDGIKEQLVSEGQSVRVTLVQTGSFRFHDHIHDEVQGTFSVTPEK